MQQPLFLYSHFTHRNAVARFLLLHKFGGYLAHILLIQRGATEVGFYVSHGQNTPIVVVRLGGDIVFRYGGQHVQRNVGRMNTFGIDLEDDPEEIACSLIDNWKPCALEGYATPKFEIPVKKSNNYEFYKRAELSRVAKGLVSVF